MLNNLFKLIFSGNRTILINRITNRKVIVKYVPADGPYDREKATCYVLLKYLGIGGEDIDKLIKGSKTDFQEIMKDLDEIKM